jgi:hypothetical protein
MTAATMFVVACSGTKSPEFIANDTGPAPRARHGRPHQANQTTTTNPEEPTDQTGTPTA